MPDGAAVSDSDRAAYELAGAATLAEQPLDPSLTLSQEPPWWGVCFSHLEARLGMLRTWRYSWWSYWAELARFLLPRRYKWLVTANTMDRGLPINQSIIDGKPTQAMRICASGLLAGLMSSSRPWFQLEIGIPGFPIDAAGQAWLEDTQERIYIVLAQSNFYEAFAQFFEDETAFGTAVCIIYEDFEDIIRCYVPCAGEYYLGAGARLSIDTHYREFTYTVIQIVEWFSAASCPEQVLKLWRQGGASLEIEFVVAHAIEPNFELSDRNGGTVRVVAGGFAYREIYWLKGIKTTKPLSVRGFHEKPFVAGRWGTTSNDAYGHGAPGMEALGDTKQVQQETLRKAEYFEKGVRPPMGADPELKNEPASIMPAHITYMDTQGGQKKGFWPLFEVDARWGAVIVKDIEALENRIDAYFFVDVFMMISQMDGVQPRNELEIAERKGEKIQRLGPMIEDAETQVAGPAVMRTMSSMERRRLLRPRPKSLQGMPIKIKYTSILKMAQRAAETASMEQGLKLGASVAAAAQAEGAPSPLRIVNLDEAYRIYLDRIGFPTKALYSQDEVDAHDQAKAKQAQAAQKFQATMAGVNAAKTLGDTNVGGGQTALGLVTGLGGPRPGAQPS